MATLKIRPQDIVYVVRRTFVLAGEIKEIAPYNPQRQVIYFQGDIIAGTIRPVIDRGQPLPFHGGYIPEGTIITSVLHGSLPGYAWEASPAGDANFFAIEGYLPSHVPTDLAPPPPRSEPPKEPPAKKGHCFRPKMPFRRFKP